MNKHEPSEFIEAEKKLIKMLNKHRDHAAKKFPLGFALIGTFGVLTTMQGYQKLIDKIPLIQNNPWISLVVGLVTLAITGTVYKKLG
jgi:hypothetical protein